MNNTFEINIETSKSYKAIIGYDILNNISDYIKKFRTETKVIIITDDIVNSLYVDNLVDNLRKNQFYPQRYIIKNGEKSKNMDIIIDILNFLADNKVNRHDIILSVGGGVVGDISGFVASIYLRGIDFIQIPTTFLSAIDSSVGGKTGVNLKNGKNLVGTFNQPLEVICDWKTFNTLSDKVFSEGVSEALKYGVLFDENLFKLIADKKLEKNSKDLPYIIKKCIELKAKIVKDDEYDRGNRQLLNLGHTIAHSIEKLSGFKIHHGIAVAIGLAIITKASESSNMTEIGTYEKIKLALEKNNLPIEINYSSEDLYEYAKLDKKILGDYINLIIPEKIGKSNIIQYDLDKLYEFIQKGR